MIDNDVLILQNCMDLLKVEPGSCCDTCLTSSIDENKVIGIKVEEGSNAAGEEVDPLLIPFTPIKSECEVSVMWQSLRKFHRYSRLYGVFLIALCPHGTSPLWCWILRVPPIIF